MTHNPLEESTQDDAGKLSWPSNRYINYRNPAKIKKLIAKKKKKDAAEKLIQLLPFIITIIILTFFSISILVSKIGKGHNESPIS